MKDCKILVLRNDNELNWQSVYNAINFVKDNYEKVDEIEDYDVYEIK